MTPIVRSSAQHITTHRSSAQHIIRLLLLSKWEECWQAAKSSYVRWADWLNSSALTWTNRTKHWSVKRLTHWGRLCTDCRGVWETDNGIWKNGDFLTTCGFLLYKTGSKFGKVLFWQDYCQQLRHETSNVISLCRAGWCRGATSKGISRRGSTGWRRHRALSSARRRWSSTLKTYRKRSKSFRWTFECSWCSLHPRKRTLQNMRWFFKRKVWYWRRTLESFERPKHQNPLNKRWLFAGWHWSWNCFSLKLYKLWEYFA